MKEASPAITLQRATEQHVQGLVALYSHPQVTRQVLQLPYPSAEIWRKRLGTENERLVPLVALHEGEVIGNCSLEQYARVRLGHSGGIGMAVAPAWQGQGVGSRLLQAVLEVADNWMGLQRVELTVYTDNQPALALYKRHGFDVEGQLLDYALRDGVLTDVYSMARLKRRGR
ncbi:GNAT family N-acetyltransferase [Pseudomonas sp. JQ170]|jgi:putative acetyltransferase|uniref:GNAT family N-acetyltransferase n=1 Tax=unclassified Pseudomonas TaxID=196821 RepID=UPI002651B725|nr:MULTISPECIES: GNAT family N-acetyltransferase [unclassified Pseudomonas]MDN7143112.1 GNAT family N-acetyltransferase [Pseudomonas sp. JQ170]WRO74357.1 GNAT family N-acetyltransferase [Pseudomonas sp. 170C]